MDGAVMIAGSPDSRISSCVVNTFTCKVCGAQKKDANHWYMAAILEESGARFAVLTPWNIELELDIASGEVVPVCGEGDAHILISRWFDHRSFEERIAKE